LSASVAEGAGEDGGVAGGDEEVFFDPLAAGFTELLAQGRVVGEARLEVRESGERGMEAGGEIPVAECADVPGVDELLEGVGDGETEERFAEGERFADEVVAGIDDGVGTAGEVFEDRVLSKGLKVRVPSVALSLRKP
jgi:hypothetical protein